jgi:hypothetical protein
MSGTRQRTSVLAAVIFGAHLFAIYALHTPAPMVMQPASFSSARFLHQPPALAPGAEPDGINDPMVFAGAHQHGFSAAAWLMPPREDYSITKTVSPPHFLEFNRPATEFPATEISAPRTTLLPIVEIPIPTEAPKSTFAIEGALKDRPLRKIPELPLQVAADVLSSTVIQVGVQADGFPFSGRIIGRSGSPAADLAALKIANEVRFAPISPAIAGGRAELQWGEIVFRWFTAEPNATNAPPTGASVPVTK